MSRLDDKSNNEILLELKQLGVEHESIKLTMAKDYDMIESLKIKMKKDWLKMLSVEERYTEGNQIIVKRLKGDI